MRNPLSAFSHMMPGNDNNPWAKIERLQAETAEVIDRAEITRAMAEWKPRLDAIRGDILFKSFIRESNHA